MKPLPLKEQIAIAVPAGARSSDVLALSNVVHSFFATALGSGVVISVGMAAFESLFTDWSRNNNFAGMIATWCLLFWVLLVEAPLTIRMLFWTVAAGGVEPVMLRAARLQRSWPIIIRQFAGLWWVTHVLFPLMFPIGMIINPAPFEKDFPEEGGWHLRFFIMVGLALFIVFLCSLSFGYGVMSWACFDRNDERLERLWSLRWWWVAFCGAVCLLATLISSR